ncbi:hypothetical protein Calle1_29 [Cellulophaga phage Calle_1]|uniref:Uncharacterized protein n=1 Tax=Cellulophaga phage Calle_1 TaxID=2745643 RepID=A0A8E4ZJ08_9CAUD|nr:hypothetical protein M1M22_gp029 [Cellulophaga phage Calle_1]QQV89701.1 hypothetical protein Calle1_29 [Cellulophaga phage Calle_1]QQV89803.1 hypothetical protein Calle2_29 [Cellulophaga phage Calle_2]QQV89916.1 hypothetical protein Calle3_29 [Cellulophaga phage Calle_3]
MRYKDYKIESKKKSKLDSKKEDSTARVYKRKNSKVKDALSFKIRGKSKLA